MSGRRSNLAQLHVAAKVAGLDDEAYRDRLEMLTGHRSASQLSDDELDACVAKFTAGLGPRRASRPEHQAKIKALWIACWNLAALDDGSDRALDAFVKRQTGKERLAFVGPEDARLVTEALKAIGARAGWMVPANDPGGMKARVALLRAQWRRLSELGAVRIANDLALNHWGHNRRITTCLKFVDTWKRQELDEAARKLGVWLRGKIKEKSAHG